MATGGSQWGGQLGEGEDPCHVRSKQLVSLFDQLETKKDISGRQWLSCVNLCG